MAKRKALEIIDVTIEAVSLTKRGRLDVCFKGIQSGELTVHRFNESIPATIGERLAALQPKRNKKHGRRNG